ncbi:MAG TPA: DUF4136 domain-containing protein [Chitinophagaceae bacterium]|nr:DUF4136 domain-containing protein [Chitinophagaceae bacterium]
MKRIHVGIGSVLVIAALMLSACGVQSYVEKDPSVNLNDYKTYAWLTDKETKRKDGKSYKNFQESYLVDRVSQELDKSGWQKARNAGSADVLIDYDIMVEDEFREQSQSVYSRPQVRYFYNPYTRRINSVYYPSQYLGEDYYTVPYKSGTITINIVDAKSNKLVWQGWAETDVTNKRIQQDDMNRIVKSIFKKFDVAKR